MSEEKNIKKFADTEKLILEDLKKESSQDKKKPSWFSRKSKKLKKKLGEFWLYGKTGFLMGSFVGSIMGFFGGCVSAYQTKSLLPIPISMIGSAFFFGSLMGVGACLRGDEIYNSNNKDDKNIKIHLNQFTFNKETGKLEIRNFKNGILYESKSI